MMSGAKTRLASARIEPEVAHQLPRIAEPADVADRSHEACRDRQIDAGDRHQPLDGAVVERSLGNLAVKDGKVLAEPVEFPQMAVDRLPFVVGQRLARQPCPPRPIEQVRVRTVRNEMRMQNCMHFGVVAGT